MIKFFKKGKKEPENLKEVLKRFRDLEKNYEKLSVELEKLKEKSQFSVQKIGIVRFNPFKDIGGDQSFSLALLDGKDNGIVITSLYTRNENRIYGKPVKAGRSDYSLSAEEKEAIEKAKAKENEKRNSKKLNQQATSGGGFRPR